MSVERERSAGTTTVVAASDSHMKSALQEGRRSALASANVAQQRLGLTKAAQAR